MTDLVPMTRMVECLEEVARVSQAMAERALAADAAGVAALRSMEGAAKARLAAATAALRGAPPPSGDARALLARIAASRESIRASGDAMAVAEGSRATVERFGDLFARQGIANLPSIAAHPSIAALRGRFAGVPAILVSPGPSLEKNVHALREVRGRALVVAMSHALSALARAGVVPDLAIATDSQDLRYHFDGAPIAELGGLVLGAAVHPDLFALPARRFFTVGANTHVDAWLYEAMEPHAPVPSGGSVATTAFALARAWGAGPIALVGQDLAFSDGRFYAPSSVDGAARLELRGGAAADVVGGSEGLSRLGAEGARLDLVEAPGWDGRPVVTSRAFAVARRFFEDEIRRLDGVCAVYNCTEGGARIAGAIQAPLAGFVADLAPIGGTVAERLDAARASIDPSARRAAALAEVERVLSAVSSAAAAARAAERAAEDALRKPSRADRLAGPEAELGRALRAAYVLSVVAQSDLRAAEERGARARSLAEALEASRDLFRAIRRRAGELGPPLEAARARLQRESRNTSST